MWTKNFAKTALICLLFSIVSLGAFGQGYRQLSTKELQLQALGEAINVIRHQYGGLEIKEKLYGLDLNALETKYAKMIRNAVTVDESVGFTPLKPRTILDRHQFRSLLVAMVSELHDGHVVIQAPTSRATAMGLRTAAIDGLLFVTGISKTLKPVHQDQEAKIADEIISIDGRPVAHYKMRNLNYIGNGTIEARKDEALERILEIPHSIIPPFSTKPTVEVTFKRGDQIFTNTYEWKNIDPIDLTRPVRPDQLPTKASPYKEDQPLVFGAKGMVRSYFMEGLFNLARIKVKDTGKPLIELLDVGEELNFVRSGRVKNVASQITLSQSQEKLQRAFKNHEVDSMAGALSNVGPVDRVKAYIVNTPNAKPFGVIRLPSYSPDGIDKVFAEIEWIEEVISIFQSYEGLDTIVIDQLSNPGGYLVYARMLLSLFATNQKPLKALRAQLVLNDRLLNDNYLRDRPGFSEANEDKRRAYLEAKQNQIENGDRISPPEPFALDTTFELGNEYGLITPREDSVQWEGKLVVLADSRSASCAEIVPAILKDNGRAKVIGEKTMGLGNPLCHHFSALNFSEMDFTGPFASCERPNSEEERIWRYIENIGVNPDLYRTIGIDDLRGGFVGYALDVIGSVVGHSAGLDDRTLQVNMNKRRHAKGISQSLDIANKANSLTLDSLINQFQEDFAKIDNNNLELSSEQYQVIYKRFLGQLDDLERANLIPASAWKLLSVPLPFSLVKIDPILATSTRKDVILRRFEEMIDARIFANRPNTLALVNVILSESKNLNGYFHFGTPCEMLLK